MARGPDDTSIAGQQQDLQFGRTEINAEEHSSNSMKPAIPARKLSSAHAVQIDHCQDPVSFDGLRDWQALTQPECGAKRALEIVGSNSNGISAPAWSEISAQGEFHRDALPSRVRPLASLARRSPAIAWRAARCHGYRIRLATPFSPSTEIFVEPTGYCFLRRRILSLPLEVKIGGHQDHVANGHPALPGQHEYDHLGNLTGLDQAS